MKKAMVLFVTVIVCAVLLVAAHKGSGVENRYVLSGTEKLEDGTVVDIDALWEQEKQDPNSDCVQIYYDREANSLCWVYVDWCMVSND